MKVYITYDRYGYDEWYQIYNVAKSLNLVKTTYKKDLAKFIGYGPDDNHSFQVQVVDMSQADYDTLLKLWKNADDADIEDRALIDFMSPIYDNLDSSNCLVMSNGYEDNDAIVRNYCKEKGLDPDNYEDYYTCQEELFSDEALYDKKLKEYIEAEY